MLIDWLPNKPNKVELLLNSNIHGDSGNIFHQLCDGKGPTYSIIETVKGHKFGGYTNKSWDNLYKPIRDDNAFIFSLDTKRKYPIKNKEKAIGGGENNRLCLFFGYSDNSIVTFNECCHENQGEKNYIEKGAYDFDKTKENGGERHFTIKSYEVYSIS